MGDEKVSVLESTQGRWYYVRPMAKFVMFIGSLFCAFSLLASQIALQRAYYAAREIAYCSSRALDANPGKPEITLAPARQNKSQKKR